MATNNLPITIPENVLPAFSAGGNKIRIVTFMLYAIKSDGEANYTYKCETSLEKLLGQAKVYQEHATAYCPKSVALEIRAAYRSTGFILGENGNASKESPMSERWARKLPAPVYTFEKKEKFREMSAHIKKCAKLRTAWKKPVTLAELKARKADTTKRFTFKITGNNPEVLKRLSPASKTEGEIANPFKIKNDEKVILQICGDKKIWATGSLIDTTFPEFQRALGGVVDLANPITALPEMFKSSDGHRLGLTFPKIPKCDQVCAFQGRLFAISKEKGGERVALEFGECPENVIGIWRKSDIDAAISYTKSRTANAPETVEGRFEGMNASQQSIRFGSVLIACYDGSNSEEYEKSVLDQITQSAKG